MLKNVIILTCLALLASCNAKQSVNPATSQESNGSIDAGDETYTFADSTERVRFSVTATMPLTTDAASMLIRESLTKVLDEELSHIEYDPRLFAPYKGKDKSLKAILDYYGSHAFAEYQNLAENDYNERKEYLSNDSTLSDKERQQRIKDTPQWEHTSTISKEYDGEKYVVYLHQTYTYMGGAHGGVSGEGSITFNRSTGTRITRFFTADAQKGMQRLIKEGLKGYFSEYDNKVTTDEELMGQLLLEGNTIPLPAQAPYLSNNGLVLTYQQYEIAPYAAGMPNFTIPYEDAMPYLTDEIKELLFTKRYILFR